MEKKTFRIGGGIVGEGSDNGIVDQRWGIIGGFAGGGGIVLSRVVTGGEEAKDSWNDDRSVHKLIN